MAQQNDDSMIEATEASKETTHRFGHDPWYQASLLLTTGVVSAYVLGYSKLVMVPLGWIGGTAALVSLAAVSLYANILMARLHETGGKRQIRYRDLAGHIYGRRAYFITWFLQYANLFLLDAGFLILGGQALKATYVLYRDDGALKLPYCIVIAGFFCAVFALGIPHLSALRVWLGLSTVLSLTYVIIAIVLCFKDGSKAPRRDYSIPGTSTGKFFGIIGAMATLVSAYSVANVPELQATLKSPAVKNMEKALWLQFTVGSVPLFAVTFTGYWAFGSSTSGYLLDSVNGSTWVLTLANVAAFLQSIIAFHILANPMYEFIDTRYGKGKGHAFSFENLSFRVVTRGGYMTVNTLMAAALPFLGDFMTLAAAICTAPLVLVLGNHMYLTVKKNKMSRFQRSWHWINAVGFSLLAFVAATAAVRFIVLHFKTYHIFADV